MAAAAANSAAKPKFRYLSAWFCPFAHRATIALEHHAARVDYEWVEALGWEQRDDDDDANTVTGREWYYHWKAEELKRVNPSALVPTLIPLVDNNSSSSGGNNNKSEGATSNKTTATATADESKAVWESLVVTDYIDAVSGAVGTDRLVPVDPYEAARCRIWADRVNRECCSPYYGVLVRKDPVERKEHFDKLLEGLANFSAELSKTPGPTFLANAQLSSVDVALIPWAYRYYVLEHYRGPEYVIPVLKPYAAWYDHVMNLDSVKRTLPDKGRYLEHIEKYADGTARSKVANAVRRGVAAHELDDEKDKHE